MSKTAILVLCYAAPKIIDKVIGVLPAEHFTFYLHVDAKLDIDQYKAQMENADRAHFIPQRHAIFWGGFRMIEAELALADAALADPYVDKVVLISDDTAPVRRPAIIMQALEKKPDRVTCIPNGRPKSWYDDYFLPDSNFSNIRGIKHDERGLRPADVEQIKRMEKLRKRGKAPLETLYFGRQWWALGRASLVAVVEKIKQDEHLTESFRYSLFPDETFFQTIYKLCFPEARSMIVPTYAGYDKRRAPLVFSTAAEVRERELETGQLFARKIKPDCPEVVTQLAEKWISAPE